MPATARRLRPASGPITLAFALALAWSAPGLAQAKKDKDDDLADLLKQVEKSAKKDEPRPKPDPKAAKPGPKPKADEPAAKAKPRPKVEPKDEELDSILKGLGQTTDAPSADGKPPEPPPGGEGQPPPKPGDGAGGEGDGGEPPPGPGEAKKPKPSDGLTGDDKALDEHLKGTKPKPKRGNQGQGGGQGQGQGGEESGPMGDLIKQMREVERRLGEPDTGDETRQKQGEIVKRMNTLIEQMQLARNQQQALRQVRQGNKPGQPNRPDQPGAMAGGPPPTVPARPRTPSVVARNAEAWGHLPPELRQEMENTTKEEVLPAKEDLIRRYFISVAKKSNAGGN